MKYVAIIDSDDELSEGAIKNLVKNTTFVDCGETPYCFEITSIKQAPEEEPVLVPYKIKQAREEIENEVKFWSEPPKVELLPSVRALRAGKANSYKHCLEILDKLIESEG